MSYTTPLKPNKKTNQIKKMLDDLIKFGKPAIVSLTAEQYADWMNAINKEVRKNMVGNPYYCGIELININQKGSSKI